MTAFPWLFTIVLVLLVAWIVLSTCQTCAYSVRERRIRLTQPTLRLILAVAVVELVLLLVWGAFLRPR